MDTKIIAGIFICLLIIGGIAFVAAVSSPAENQDEAEPQCGGACTLESNCGSPSCGAISGGTCGCGR